MKTKIITILITLGAFIDQTYAVFADNAGLLAEIGISPKTTRIILVVGLIWNAFAKSLAPVKAQTFANEIGLPIPRDPKKNP